MTWGGEFTLALGKPNLQSSAHPGQQPINQPTKLAALKRVFTSLWKKEREDSANLADAHQDCQKAVSNKAHTPRLWPRSLLKVWDHGPTVTETGTGCAVLEGHLPAQAGVPGILVKGSHHHKFHTDSFSHRGWIKAWCADLKSLTIW